MRYAPDMQVLDDLEPSELKTAICRMAAAIGLDTSSVTVDGLVSHVVQAHRRLEDPLLHGHGASSSASTLGSRCVSIASGLEQLLQLLSRHDIEPARR